jgi:hypothetical protein
MAIDMQQLGKHVPTATNMHTTMELVEVAFYMQSCRSYIRRTNKTRKVRVESRCTTPRVVRQ